MPLRASLRDAKDRLFRWKEIGVGFISMRRVLLRCFASLLVRFRRVHAMLSEAIINTEVLGDFYARGTYEIRIVLFTLPRISLVVSETCARKR